MSEKRLVSGQAGPAAALPDTAFAVVLEGGTKGDDGRTVPLTLRMFPHHDAAGKVSPDLVSAALSQLTAADIEPGDQAKAQTHLEGHGAPDSRAAKPYKAKPGETVKCGKCGKMNSTDAKFCDQCGAKLSSGKAAGHSDTEYRVIAAEGVKIERRDGGIGRKPVTTFEGYGALFGARTLIGGEGGLGQPPGYGSFYEEVAPGAFARSLVENDAVMLFNHNPDLLLGRKSAGTLSVREDQHGLWTQNNIPDTGLGRDLTVQTERGDITGMSFSFNVAPGGERWTLLPDGEELRTLGDLDLFDVGPVTFPQYTQTTFSQRAVDMGRRNAPALTGNDPAADGADARREAVEALEAREESEPYTGNS